MRSGNMSPIAVSWTFGADARQFSAAPDPRPPQPTRPILIVVSWPAAWTRGTVDRKAAVAALPDFTKSRRVMGSDMRALLRFIVPSLRVYDGRPQTPPFLRLEKRGAGTLVPTPRSLSLYGG